MLRWENQQEHKNFNNNGLLRTGGDPGLRANLAVTLSSNLWGMAIWVWVSLLLLNILQIYNLFLSYGYGVLGKEIKHTIPDLINLHS